jgi:hypothetical protein
VIGIQFFAKIITSTCKNCNLPAIVNKNGICWVCDPDKNLKFTEQKETVDFLVSENIRIESVDRPINSSSKLYRPDIIVNSKNGSFKIVVEVDEGQHKRYSYEDMRMRDIADIFSLPTLFIRFNPSEYKTPDPDEIPMKMRLVKLKQVIDTYMNMETLPYTICALYMYYDGWSEQTPPRVYVIET